MGTLFPGGGTDDAYYSLFQAWTLSEHGQVCNYNGELVEQSSSLLHVLLLGGLHSIFGGDLVLLNAILLLLASIGTLYMAWLLARKWVISANGPTLAGMTEARTALVPLLLSLTGIFAYWSWGKLDTALAVFFMTSLAWFLLRFLETGRKVGFLLAAIGFVLVRPENYFIGFTALVVFSATALFSSGPPPVPGAERTSKGRALHATNEHQSAR